MRNVFSRLRKFHQRKRRITLGKEWKRENKAGNSFKSERVLDRDEIMQVSREGCV